MNYFITCSNRDIISNSNFDNNCINLREDREIVNLLQRYYNSDNINVDDIQTIYNKTSVEALFEELNQYASKFFKTNPTARLSIRTNTINISQSKDTVYINDAISSAFLSFVLLQFYQSDLIDNPVPNGDEEKLFCYRYLIFILNEMCFSEFGLPLSFPNDESHRMFLDKFLEKRNILNISSDMFNVAMSFALLHELSHAYLKHSEEDDKMEKELEADKYAYRILLNFYSDIKEGRIDSEFKECFSDYMLMAPLILLEFYYVVFYTGSFLSSSPEFASKEMFDEIVKRKESLLEVFYAWDGEADEQKAYGLYNSYLNGEELFLRTFVASDKAGCFDELRKKNKKRRKSNE